MVNHIISNISDDDRVRAILSGLSYLAPAKNNEVSSLHRLNNELDNLSVLYPKFATKLNNMEVIDSNYDSAIIKDNSSGTCYLSSRGTSLQAGQSTALRDTYNDTKIALGYTPNRSLTTEKFLIKNMSDHPECSDWEAVGHSLGGRVVEDIGIKHPEIKVTSFEAGRTFNDPNFHSNLLHSKSNITSHKVIGDPISIGPSPGTSIFHTLNHDNSNAYLNPLNSHSLSNYIN